MFNRVSKLVKIVLFSSACMSLLLFTSYGTYETSQARDELMDNPYVKAFLDVIAYAEGTLHDDGYKTLYGGELFHDFSDHPRQPIARWSQNKLLISTAAGRYQILARCWDSLAHKLQLADFSPRNQDRLALALIRQMGALKSVVAGEFEKAIKKISSIWASLPGSSYNQPIVSIRELKRIYIRRLRYYGSSKM